MNWENINQFGVALEVGDVLHEGDTYRSPLTGQRRKAIYGDEVTKEEIGWDLRRPLHLAGPRPETKKEVER